MNVLMIVLFPFFFMSASALAITDDAIVHLPGLGNLRSNNFQVMPMIFFIGMCQLPTTRKMHLLLFGAQVVRVLVACMDFLWKMDLIV